MPVSVESTCSEFKKFNRYQLLSNETKQNKTKQKKITGGAVKVRIHLKQRSKTIPMIIDQLIFEHMYSVYNFCLRAN